MSPATLVVNPTQEVTPSAQLDANIVEKAAKFVRRFVFFRDASLYLLVALWMIHTHLVDVFEYTGYLFITSPEMNSGKTRVLDVINLLAAYSSDLLISPTEAVLFRTAHGMTQLFDEVDTWTNLNNLNAVLNAGFKRGATVIRMKQTEKHDYEKGKFSVFAARALSGIGSHILTAPTRSRTFAIEMVRQTKAEKRERFRSRDIGPEAKRLKAEIGTWAQENKAAIDERYRGRFDYLDSFNDRTIDITEPLAAILEVAYSGDADIDEHRFNFLHAVSIVRKENAEGIVGHRTLRALRDLSATQDPLIGSASELAALCGQLETDVSRTLRVYGFEAKSIRKGDDSRRRYELSHATLTDIVKRYVVPEAGPW